MEPLIAGEQVVDGLTAHDDTRAPVPDGDDRLPVGWFGVFDAVTPIDADALHAALPPGDGADTIRKWEVTGPSGPVAELLRILAMASDHYPILDMFNIFDRHDVPVQERPARRKAFREQMRSDVRRRIA